MIISKDSWIIHIFAALHAIVSFVCYSTGIADELMLTLLTMFLVVMLCFRRRVGVLFMAIAVILVNPLGFSVGMGLASLLSLLPLPVTVVHSLSTLVCTEILGWSTEFCGGTHLDNTAKVGMFAIISEGSVASGVRRIEAITGKEVIERYAAMSGMLSRVADKLKTRPVEIMAKVENNLSEIHDLKQKLDKMKDQLMSGEAERMLYGAKDIKGLKVITITNGPVNAADIRKMGDQLKDRFPNIVAVLAATAEDKATMLAVCGKNAVARGIKAGDLIKNITKLCGGSGGGKPDSAMGGCKEILKLDDAMAAVDDFVNANAKD